jgi:hypothetical protein
LAGINLAPVRGRGAFGKCGFVPVPHLVRGSREIAAQHSQTRFPWDNASNKRKSKELVHDLAYSEQE